MSTAYIALGSNLGDRAANLRTALEAFEPGIHILEQSDIYETSPWGYTDQPDFLNMAVRAETQFAPRQLLDYLKQIEMKMGREPTFRYGPRTIDLDILFYDEQVINEAGLVIPHPRLHERAFVLVPLAEIALELTHPVLKKTVLELLSNVDTGDIKKSIL